MVVIMSEINFEIEDRDTKIEIPENLVFGRIFTNYMLEMDYDQQRRLGKTHD